MRYMGGKYRQSKGICSTIEKYCGREFDCYCEPFCGGLWSASAVCEQLKPRSATFADINQSLILLWDAIINHGFEPPTTVTDEIYEQYKRTQDMTDPLTAWYGIACSFGGKWFGGLARTARGRCDSYDFSSALRPVLRQAQILQGSKILCCSYQDLDIPDMSVVYCDPPYEGRTKAHKFDSFDYTEFWEWVRNLSKRCGVFTSCFDCPDDFATVYEWGDTVSRHLGQKGTNITNEKLVIYKDGLVQNNDRP